MKRIFFTRHILSCFLGSELVKVVSCKVFNFTFPFLHVLCCKTNHKDNHSVKLRYDSLGVIP